MFVQPANLAKDQREIYFAALKKLADAAEVRGDFDAAIAELRLYLEGGGSGELNVYRRLADLHAKAGDTMNAVLMVETGLTYNSTDADLLKKKDSYYYSLPEERLIAVKEKVAGYFDTAYCVRKAMSILNAKSDDPELIDWATHLSKLAMLMQPAGNGVRLVQARCLLRRGERDAGISIMEKHPRGEKRLRRRGGSVVQRHQDSRAVVLGRIEPAGPGGADVPGLQGIQQEWGRHAVSDRPGV